jgi:GNAT superfamily N-acetyltransferase
MKKRGTRRTPKKQELDVRPLTPERWPDLEALFGERGACAGCWCMWWRLTRPEFEKTRGAGTKRAFKKITKDGEVPGLIAYRDGQPIGWCALAPRNQYCRFETSRVLKPVDDKEVWSITCFFVARPFRGCGITGQLLKAALDYAREQGASVVEGYPIDPQKGRWADPFVYTGLVSTFRKVGFVEVLRRSETRPIMRYTIRQ